MIKDGIEFKECDKCGKLCAKLEMVNWKTCKECVISELEAKNAELTEKVEGYDRNRDRLIAMGFPHFRNCKEYADKLEELEKEVTRLRNEGLDNINKYTRFAETDRKTITKIQQACHKWFMRWREAKKDTIKLIHYETQLTKAREIILRLYNAGRDVLMCRAEEKAYDNLSNAINDKSIEQFLSEVENDIQS